MLEEGVTPIDAAYMTVITISTVGYKEVFPLDAAGRLWTIFVIVFGVGTFSLAFSSMLAVLVSGELRALRERRRMQALIDKAAVKGAEISIDTPHIYPINATCPCGENLTIEIAIADLD